MRRVLIVSPRFPPANAPDMHRVRQILPYLREHGWDPTVLAVRPEDCEVPLDPWLAETVPDDVPVVWADAIDVAKTRRLGLSSLDIRALPGLRREGNRLLADEPFDLVFFSTTAFLTMTLGRYWRRRWGVPYVLDMQDPWRSDYYRVSGVAPPGGRLKNSVMQALARVLEPPTLRGAAHIVTVSPAYPPMFRAHYPDLPADRFTVLPFGAPEADFERLRQHPVAHDLFDPDDGLSHWLYVGAAGPIMEHSLTALFTALHRSRQKHPQRFERVRLHFVGTSYAPEGHQQPSVAPIARACGVSDLVEERPARVPYAQALQAMLDADALLMPGSDDPGYTASKLYPTLLARKPLLAIFHEASSVLAILRETHGGIGVGFTPDEPPDATASRIAAAWFQPQAWTAIPPTDWDAFARYTAHAMTRRLIQTFDAAL